METFKSQTFGTQVWSTNLLICSNNCQTFARHSPRFVKHLVQIFGKYFRTNMFIKFVPEHLRINVLGQIFILTCLV